MRQIHLLTFPQSVRKSGIYGTSLAHHRRPTASVDFISLTKADVWRQLQMEQYFQQMKRLLRYQRRGAKNGPNRLGQVRIQTLSHELNEREIATLVWEFDPFFSLLILMALQTYDKGLLNIFNSWFSIGIASAKSWSWPSHVKPSAWFDLTCLYMISRKHPKESMTI